MMEELSKRNLIKLTKIVSDILGHNNFELNLDIKASDIAGWDSLSHVQIIHECETALGVRFTLNEISNLNTIGDLINLINKKS